MKNTLHYTLNTCNALDDNFNTIIELWKIFQICNLSNKKKKKKEKVFSLASSQHLKQVLKMNVGRESQKKQTKKQHYKARFETKCPAASPNPLLIWAPTLLHPSVRRQSDPCPTPDGGFPLSKRCKTIKQRHHTEAGGGGG